MAWFKGAVSGQRLRRLHHEENGVQDQDKVHPVLEPRVLDHLAQPFPPAAGVYV